MGGTNFDWRWVVVIFNALVFFGQINVFPTPVVGVVLLALGAYWAVSAGLEPWRGRNTLLGSKRYTYWRGQRIELGPTRRTRVNLPPTTSLIVSLLYLSLGIGLILAALRLLLRLVGV